MSKTIAANDSTAPGYRIALIVLGIAMTPVLLASSSLGSQLSLNEAILAIALGSLILTVIGCITCSIGEHARMTTYQIVRFSFGTKGASAINSLLAISLFGWICVTANGFGHVAQDLLGLLGWQVPLAVLVALGCVIFVIITRFGFATVSKLALYAIPVLTLLLVYNLYRLLNSAELSNVHTASMSMGIAVSTVVGTFMVLVATLPDFGSFVHNRRHALIGVVLALGIAYPLLYLAGALPSIMTGQNTLVAAMAVAGVVAPALLLLLLATITGNAGNVFQGTLVISTLLKTVSQFKITLGLTFCAAIIGSLPIMSWFIPFLLFLGVATPPIAGIYIADFFLYRRGGYDEALLETQSAVQIPAFIAWLAGAAVGWATQQGLSLTSIPSLDSLLVASVLFVLLKKAFGNKA